MRNNSTLIISLCLCAAIVITLAVLRDPRPAEGVGASEAARPDDRARASATLARMRGEATRLLTERASVPAAEYGLGADDDAVARAAATFEDMQAVAGRVHTSELRDELADRLLEDPRSTQLMRDIVVDPAFARRAFADRQAEARYFAAVTLTRAARRGDREALETAIQQVAAELNGAEALDPGRSADLADLLGGFLASQAVDDLTASTLVRLGLRPEMSRAVRAIYVKEVFYDVWHRVGHDQAQAKVASIFHGDETRKWQ